MNHWINGLILLCLSASVFGQEHLVRFKKTNDSVLSNFLKANGGQLELVSSEGNLYKWTSQHRATIRKDANVAYVAKNYKIRIFQSPSLIENQRYIYDRLNSSELNQRGPAYPDNPEIKTPAIQASGLDPLLKNSWGMFSIDAPSAHSSTPQGKGIVVAVTDTGVDYNHVDLASNMWRNK